MTPGEEEPDVSPTGDGEAQELLNKSKDPYEVYVMRAAKRDLRKLDKQVLREQIQPVLKELAKDPYQHPTEDLKADLVGLRKWRTGDYRVIYKVEDGVAKVLVVGARHRSTVYEAVKSRTSAIGVFIRSLRS